MQVQEDKAVMEVLAEERKIIMAEMVLTQDLQGRKGLQSMDKLVVMEVMEAIIVMVICWIEVVTLIMEQTAVQVLTLL